MVKLLISHTVSSSKNGSTDHGAKSLYRVTLYANAKYSRSAKRFSSKVSWLESSYEKDSYEKREEIFGSRNDTSRLKYSRPLLRISMSYGRKLSTNSLLYDSSPTLLETRCGVCTGEPHFVLREMGDTSKEKALDDLIVDKCKINKKMFDARHFFDSSAALN